jgi:hypothetical protein
MANNGTKTRQARMVAALLDPAHKTQDAACAAAGVPSRTLQRWLAEDDFQDALRSAEGQLVNHAARRLLTLTDDAIAALASNLDEYSKPAHSLRAAELVLSHVLRWRELGDLEARIAALEAQP